MPTAVVVRISGLSGRFRRAAERGLPPFALHPAADANG
jgi:hypothetical protein